MRVFIACVQAIMLFSLMATGFVPAAAKRTSRIQRTPAIVACTMVAVTGAMPPSSPEDVPDLIGANEQVDDDDTMTLEELSLRFVDVLEHYRETKEMSHDEVCLAMLRTRLQDLKLKRCELGKSSISGAGWGVFANRACRKGELITLFAGDALLVWNCGTVGDFSQGVGVLFGNHIVERNPTLVTSAAARGYELKIRTSHSIVADPLLNEDAGYLGHMINDGAMLQGPGNEARGAYSQASFKAHNSIFEGVEGCHYAVIATRDIIAGEELFVSYGEGYWLSRLENEPELKSLATPKRKKKSNSDSKIQRKKKPIRATGGGGFGQ